MPEHADAETMVHPSISLISTLVEEKTGLAVSGFGANTLEPALHRARQRLLLPTVEQLANRLMVNDEAAFGIVVEELTVRETHFFREAQQIAVLRDVILPGLIESHAGGRGLRVWSAGCATGEEAYTLGILLEEAGCLQQAQIIGTDISRDALKLAEKGVYRKWSMRGVDLPVMRRFFDVDDDRYVVARNIRAYVRFAHLNLLSPTWPSVLSGVWDLDLILCRNVFIYFGEQAVREVSGRMFEALAEGGWLMLGPSDPLLEDPRWESVTNEAGTFYRRPRADAEAPKGRPPVPTSRGARISRIPYRRSPSTRRSQPVNLASSSPSAAPKQGSAVATADAAATALTRAREALKAGDYAKALHLTDGVPADAAALAVRLRALSGTAPPHKVEPIAAEAVHAHPLSAELHFLHALTLMDSGRDREAIAALNHVVYLDPTLALAHFFLGTVHARQHDRASARRAWRNAQELTRRLPRDSELALSYGELAGALHDAARANLVVLDFGDGR